MRQVDARGGMGGSAGLWAKAQIAFQLEDPERLGRDLPPWPWAWSGSESWASSGSSLLYKALLNKTATENRGPETQVELLLNKGNH